MPGLPALIVAVLALAGALAAAAYYRLWGGLLFICVMAAGYAWYRLQVARNAAAEKFFDGMGEETRLTGLQGGSPSEMPADRAGPTGRDAPRH